MKGDSVRTTRSGDGGTPLIFPLMAKPDPRRGRLGKAMAGGLIAAVLAGAVVAAINQLNPDPAAGKWAIVASGREKPVDQVDVNEFSVFELRPGTCLRELTDDTDVRDVPVVACEEDHAAEVVASLRMPDGAWPGAAAVDTFADDRCVTAILRAGVAGGPSLRWTYFGPTEISWNVRNDRMISCMVVNSSASLTGSVTDESGVRPGAEQ